jgi:hypothetical protein
MHVNISCISLLFKVRGGIDLVQRRDLWLACLTCGWMGMLHFGIRARVPIISLDGLCKLRLKKKFHREFKMQNARSR